MTRYFWVLEVTFKLELAIANSDPEVGTQLKNDYMYERDTRFLNETIQMPDMLFVCSGCGMGRGCQHPPMPWPDIYIHRTTAHGDVSAFEDKACLNPRASVWKPVAGPDGLVNRVLKAVGLDKEETTVKGLNLLVSSGKLHCACGTLEEHHSWAGLMYHFARHGQQGKDAQGNDQLGISTIHAPRRSLANSQVS
ncbi:hypothetical protein C8Q79DRAFT_1012557 [Trametes meyenii]|nr:hypothetical protein C8Q79DRAFT_1012557 [Trametes meyenii]